MSHTCIQTPAESANKLLSQTPRSLLPIAKKVIENIRLDAEDAILLLTDPDIEAIQRLADFARKKRAGDVVYFASTLYIYPTNLCELSCPLCSFYAKPGWKNAWFMTPDQIEEKIRGHLHENLTEIHIVGGLWRECTLDYYKEVFTRIKAIDEKLHIKAMTPVEYDFLAKLHDISVEEVFTRMMSWGLGSLPGGGAEILVEEIRKKIAPGKISSDRYLEIHKIAHQLGLPSNVSMLFGHIETPHHIATHLMKVRCLQDETKGFQTFVPLKFHIENNALGKRTNRLQPKDIRRIYATCRLMLDNIRNLKVLWNYVGIDEAKEMLSFGANDISATSVEEKVITMAGGIKVRMTDDILTSLILHAGRIPKKIHSGYDYRADDPDA